MLKELKYRITDAAFEQLTVCLRGEPRFTLYSRGAEITFNEQIAAAMAADFGGSTSAVLIDALWQITRWEDDGLSGKSMGCVFDEPCAICIEREEGQEPLDHSKCIISLDDTGRTVAGQGKRYPNGHYEYPCNKCLSDARGDPMTKPGWVPIKSSERKYSLRDFEQMLKEDLLPEGYGVLATHCCKKLNASFTPEAWDIERAMSEGFTHVVWEKPC